MCRLHAQEKINKCVKIKKGTQYKTKVPRRKGCLHNYLQTQINDV